MRVEMNKWREQNEISIYTRTNGTLVIEISVLTHATEIPDILGTMTTHMR